MWDKILAFVQTDIGQLVLSILSTFLGFAIFCLFKWISSKVQNSRLKKIVNIVPAAIAYAEKIGGSATEKLNTAVKFIQGEYKKAKESDCISVIESAIASTKTDVNKSQERLHTSQSVITTRRK